MTGRSAVLAGFALALLFIGLAAGVCEAVSGAADGTYTVNVTKVEMSANGTNFITLFDGSTPINIASVDAGARAASLVSGGSAPPGSYTTVRVTIGATLQVKGYVNIAGITYYTNNDSDGFGGAAGNDNQAQPDYAISSFNVPADNRVSSQTVNFTVPKGGPSPTVSVSFNTASVIVNSGGLPSLGPPSVTMSSG